MAVLGTAAVVVASMVAASSATRTARDLEQRLDATVAEIERSEAEARARLDALAARVDELARRADEAAPPDVIAVAEAARPSVVTVETTTSAGSAWVISSGATGSVLVTNFHVVSDDWVNRRTAVRLHRGDATWDGTVTEVAEADDLALIRTSTRLDALSLDRREVRAGETVVALGSPLGLDGTTTTGVVSGRRGQWIQFSAEVSPGSSGGPVLDADGEVVGVTVAKAVAPGAAGVAFAVPVTTMCEVLQVCG